MAESSRIAVVLIHGMGEPRPMAAIRSFVDAIAGRETPPIRSWSKPLDEPLLYDIRRIVMEGSRTRPVVDFYEFYWAHLLQGTTLPQLMRWIVDLVIPSPATVPAHLKGVYAAGWLLLALVALTVVLALLAILLGGGWTFLWPLVSAAVTVVYGALSYPLLGTLGDAARYLDTRPDNVAARFEIQNAGVDLIKRLHAGRTYHRIVVVGHSLGAMIGYDVLRHAWLPFAKDFAPVKRRRRGAIDALRSAIEDWPANPVPLARYRALQTAAWAEHLANGGRWRITDFITLGSPLAHAELLLATDPKDFKKRTGGRELSTCPPTWDDRFGITRDIAVKSLGPEKKPVVRTPDHAGVFALTHWTNFHSPSRFVVDGDFLSGPTAPVFGPGVRDVAVKANHVDYWTQGPASPALSELVAAMDLTGRNAVPNRAGPGNETTLPA